jgi:hypothetical protein
MTHIKKFNESITSGKMYVVSSYRGEDTYLPEFYYTVGDEKTCLKEYNDLLKDMMSDDNYKPLVLLLSEIIKFPIHFCDSDGAIEPDNTKPIKLAYHTEHITDEGNYWLPNIENDYEKLADDDEDES